MATVSSKAGIASRIVIGALLLACLGVVVHALRMRGVDEAWSERLLVWAGGAAAVFAVLFFLPAGLRINLCVSLVFVGLSAFAFNLYLAYTPPPVAAKADAITERRMATPGFDHRTVLEVVQDMNADGVKAVPALFGVNALQDEARPKDLLPLIGIATATTVLCNEIGEHAIYVADEHGHRNPPGVEDEVDVLLLGDSFAQGQCVGPGKDIAGLLRARGYSVYNVGSSGNGPLLTLAALMEYGLARRPKVVLWGYAGNDPVDLRAEMFHDVLLRYLEDASFSQGLLARQDAIDAYWRTYLEKEDYLTPRPKKKVPKWEAPPPTLSQIVTLYQLRRLLGLRRREQGAWRDTFQRILRTARERVVAQGGELYFVAFPYHELVADPPDRERTIFGIVRPTGVPIVDLDRPFFEAEDPEALFPLRMPGHFSEAGYAKVVDVLVEEVLEKTRADAIPDE